MVLADARDEPEAAVSVPNAEVLASLRRELEEKTRALQAAVSSGGLHLAATVVERASADKPPPDQLQRLLGLRSGEAVLTAEEAEERSRKLPPGYKYVSVPSMAPKNTRDGAALDDLPSAKAARVGGVRATPGGVRGRAAGALTADPHALYVPQPAQQLQQRGAGGRPHAALTPAEAEAKRKAADKERRLGIKKKIAELSALVDSIATSVAAASREQARAASSAAASSPTASGARASTAAVVWGEQTAQAKLEAVRTRRLQDICARHALQSVRQLQAHKWAWPFNEPVDAVKMNLVDYHKIVTRPMDLGTVRARLEAAGAGAAAAAAAGVPQVGGFYNHPDEVATDVRQVFANATAYNPPGSDVHVMAATLAAAFEVRWAASVVPRVAEAATAAAAEADRAAQRVAHAAATKAAEGAERKAQGLEKALAAAEQALAEARRDMAAAAPPLAPEERRALATGLRECAPSALGGAVAVLAAAAGVDASRVPDILEVDLDGPDVPMLRRLLAYVRSAPKNAVAAKKAAVAAAVEAAAAEAKAARKAAAAAARAPRAANGGADAAAGEKRKRGRPPRKREDAAPALPAAEPAAPVEPAADGDADMAPPPEPAAADVAAEAIAADAPAAAPSAPEGDAAAQHPPPPPPTAPKTAEPSEEQAPRREPSPVPPPQLFSPPAGAADTPSADAAAPMDADAAPPAPAPPAPEAPEAAAAGEAAVAMQA